MVEDPRTQSYWVVWGVLQLFIAGFETREEAEAYVAQLNQRAPSPPAEPPRYLVIPRPQHQAG